MRIAGDWLTRAETQRVLALLAAAGHRALVVGGCVRNAVIGLPASDVDIATDARPETVMALAASAGLRAVPTGIAHGTVTLVVAGAGFEVTTFRRDVATDGRRAVVAFSTDIAEDARRRDFTMNALYAEADGRLVDPLGGLADARARRVRFIEDADRRIAEDHLRILRFFRFIACYGDPALGIDPEGLAACAAGVAGLDALSRERITGETMRLLGAADPAPAVAALAAIGGLGRILPGADAAALAPLVHLEGETASGADPLRRLAALGGDAGALRLSKAERRTLDALRSALADDATAAALGYRFGERVARGARLIRAAATGGRIAPAEWPEIARGARARFPVRAADLPGLQGAALGRRLRALEARWLAADLWPTRAELLA